MNVQLRPDIGITPRPTRTAGAPTTLPLETPVALPTDGVSLGVSPSLGAPPPLSAAPAEAPAASLQPKESALPPGLALLMPLPEGLSPQGNLTSPTALMIQQNPPEGSSLTSVASAIREALGDKHPTLAKVVNKLVDDTSHPMNLVAYLKDDKRRQTVLAELRRMTDLEPHSPDSLKTVVRDSHHQAISLFNPDDTRFNEVDGRKKTSILREKLLGEQPALYGVGDTPTAEQSTLLEAHAKNLRAKVLPGLHQKLESCLEGLPQEDGFPVVNSRAKSAAGMVDKIHRMRAGNDGKAPRPDYSLADMPDAVGGRITVRNVDQLGTVMKALEDRFGADNIMEKDNFYANPSKREKPYRCITYTVLQDGVPCEVQLTTMRASLAADLWHNTGYKQLHPDLQPSEIEQIGTLQRAVTANEHRELRAGLSSA